MPCVIIMLICVCEISACLVCVTDGVSVYCTLGQHTCAYPCVSPFAGLGYLCHVADGEGESTDGQSAAHRCVKCFGLVL